MTELVSIRDCPPGLFRFGKILGFKTEYCGMETVGPINIPGDQVRWTVGNHSDVYVVESGEAFWAGAADRTARDALMVEPIDLLLPEPFLSQLRRVNLERYEAWVDGDDAGIMFDAVELGGEVGELLNIVKKLEREDRGWRGSRADPAEFPNECADVLICLDKLARRRNVDLAAVTIAKFNATSEKVGLPHRLEASLGSGAPAEQKVSVSVAKDVEARPVGDPKIIQVEDRASSQREAEGVPRDHTREDSSDNRTREAVLAHAVANILPLGDDRAPGDRVIPIYVRMDELRALRELAALSARGAA